MITLRRSETDRILELGGGDHPHVVPQCMGGKDVAIDVRICRNEHGQQTVDFAADFNEPLQIRDAEFEAVFSHFAVEHISWRKVPQLLSEIFRVLKPRGKAVIVVPNTQAQMKWIKDHPDGWDGKNAFDSASCILYGDQDYPENSHRSYFSPQIAIDVFSAAGFESVITQPYGERATDMCIEAIKPGPTKIPAMCGVEGPNGLKCQREKGHDGNHSANT